MKVELITPKSNSLEDLQEYIATLSSVVRDKQPKSAEKLFNRLLKESVGDKASRVLEYIPCTITDENEETFGKYVFERDVVQLFGFIIDNVYYTNARELLDCGAKMEDVLEAVDFTHYKVFKCEAPYFLYSQASTHNQITTVSHSQRYSDCDRGYWKPEEVKMTQEHWNEFVENISKNSLVEYMKECGVKRKEVFDRGVDSLQNRVYSFGGYTNNPNAWEHFLAQRTDSHTQLEMRILAKMIKDAIDLG